MAGGSKRSCSWHEIEARQQKKQFKDLRLATIRKMISAAM
jgi:hypothetical protein